MYNVLVGLATYRFGWRTPYLDSTVPLVGVEDRDVAMRGKAAKPGDEYTAPNGYTYVKVVGRSWVLKHWLVKEAELGRQINSKTERVIFLNGDRTDLRPENIEVRPKANGSTGKRRAQLEERIRELQAQLDELDEEE